MSNSVVGDTLPVPLRASPWGFVDIDCYTREEKQITPSKTYNSSDFNPSNSNNFKYENNNTNKENK